MDLRLFFAHVSSLIFETIHFSPLITTIKNNKIVSLFFNVRLTISLTFHLPYSFSYIYIYVITFIHFNYLILKCSNKSNQSLQNRWIGIYDFMMEFSKISRVLETDKFYTLLSYKIKTASTLFSEFLIYIYIYIALKFHSIGEMVT